jgi:hypothetical protein
MLGMEHIMGDCHCEIQKRYLGLCPDSALSVFKDSSQIAGKDQLLIPDVE